MPKKVWSFGAASTPLYFVSVLVLYYVGYLLLLLLLLLTTSGFNLGLGNNDLSSI